MFIVFFCLCLLLLYISQKVFKNFYNPVTVLVCVWGILLSMYNGINWSRGGCRDLSVLFYIYVSVYIIIFSFCNFFVNAFHHNHMPKTFAVNNILKNDKRINFIINLCIVSNFLLLFGFIKMTGTSNIVLMIGKMRYITQYEENSIPVYVKLLMYMFTMTPVVFCYVFMENVKISKLKLFLLFLQLVIITLLYVSKGRILKYVIVFVLLLYIKKKLNLKILILIFLGSLGLVYFLTFNRDKYFVNTFTLFDYSFVYFLSPFPAFDMLINGEIPYVNTPFGGRTLGFFYRVAARLFGTQIPNYGKMFLDVDSPTGKVPTNVFTALGGHYMDYGVGGIIFFAILLGLTYSIIYYFSIKSKSKTLKIFYILVVYCLVFQFFGELFFQFLSMTLQDLICAYIIVHKVRLKK